MWIGSYPADELGREVAAAGYLGDCVGLDDMACLEDERMYE